MERLEILDAQFLPSSRYELDGSIIINATNKFQEALQNTDNIYIQQDHFEFLQKYLGIKNRGLAILIKSTIFQAIS